MVKKKKKKVAKRKDYPWWAGYKSPHEFRVKKRKDIRRVMKAIDELRMGCAFMPLGSDYVDDLKNIIEDFARVCSPENWGR